MEIIPDTTDREVLKKQVMEVLNKSISYDCIEDIATEILDDVILYMKRNSINTGYMFTYAIGMALRKMIHNAKKNMK